MARVVFTGWNPGLQKVSLAKLLRSEASLSLKEAHEYVCRIMEREVVTVDMPTTEAAEDLVARAVSLGAIVTSSTVEQR